ncbi:hypothetical protein DFH07DRAFT_688135, partial [Mycena maculata]
MLLWIKNAPSPQTIRDKLTGGDSVFERKLIEYLESSHQGELSHGTVPEVLSRIKHNPKATAEEIDSQCTEAYKVPTITLPAVPPPRCDLTHTPESAPECARCQVLVDWMLRYELEVDDLLVRSNLHNCRCLTKTGICKARFPRDIYEKTSVENDGHINIKKLEAKLNTFTKVVTFFSRSNTDVTSLLSGTSVKAVISYVSDYVSKIGLKTYQAFASVFDV